MRTGLIFAAAAVALLGWGTSASADGDHQDGHMDGHMDGAGMGEAMAVGTVNSVDAAGRTVNVSHQPIPAIGWPAMTMDLPLSDRADLGAVRPGSRVEFSLEKGPDGMYRIGTIAPMSGDGMMSDPPSGGAPSTGGRHMDMDDMRDRDMGGHDMGDQSMNQESGAPVGIGVVNAVGESGASVNISHEPIPGLGWPAMTMDMAVAPAARAGASALRAGERVVFTLAAGEGGVYAVQTIAPDDGSGAARVAATARRGGNWSYQGRAEARTAAADWLMVPSGDATRGMQWVQAAGLTDAERCRALLGNARIAVDDETRRACGRSD